MTITNRVSLKSVMGGNTPIADVVDAPTIGTATAGTASATVTFTAAVTGGTAATYTATSTPGSITGSAASSPVTVSGLTNGTAYTFKVKGVNASGTWVESAASNAATPFVPPNYVVVPQASSTTYTVSTNGITWTTSTLPSGQWSAVTYGDKFVLIGQKIILCL